MEHPFNLQGKVYIISEVIQRVNGLLQWYKANWGLKAYLQDDYINFMNRRSWILLAIIIIIYVAQVYAIHRVFEYSQAPTKTVQYRMKV